MLIGVTTTSEPLGQTQMVCSTQRWRTPEFVGQAQSAEDMQEEIHASGSCPMWISRGRRRQCQRPELVWSRWKRFQSKIRIYDQFGFRAEKLPITTSAIGFSCHA